MRSLRTFSYKMGSDVKSPPQFLSRYSNKLVLLLLTDNYVLSPCGVQALCGAAGYFTNF